MKLYDVSGLRFAYPGRFQLDIDEFELGEGEKVGVVGRNGSGKTTLLRILGFLERPSSWMRFRFRGHDVFPGRTRYPEIGLLRQDPYIFQGSVSDNLAYGLKVRGMHRRAIRSRVDAMCERLGLAALAGAPAKELSGGERKRVALGRVLIWDPRVLLLDEPTTHLDAASREIVGSALSETRASLLFTTHDISRAMRLSDRMLTLRGGRISEGLPENIFEGPCWDGVLTTQGGLQIQLVGPISGPSVTVRVDPESIVLSLGPLHSSMRNVFPGIIRSVEAQGENIWTEIAGEETFVAIISRRSYEEMELNLNRRVVLSFNANAVQVGEA